MERGIKQIRRELARVARAVPGRSRRYPEPLRRAAVEVLRSGLAQGLGVRAVARQLGVSAETLRYWDRGDRGTIRPVFGINMHIEHRSRCPVPFVHGMRGGGKASTNDRLLTGY